MQPPSQLDWIIIGAYFLVTLGLGLLLSRRAGQSTQDYFVSGRSLPWWLAGTSMVATTFAVDTPLWVAGAVAKQGIAANWLWWSFLPSGLLTVFFFAALWRRSEVVTDAEFCSIRYSGPTANGLRGFRAVYFGVLVNGVILGWVNLAMVKVLSRTLGLNEEIALFVCLGITVTYSAVSGLWGIVVTDFLQFIIGMSGSVILAVFAWNAVGGLSGLEQGLAECSRPVTPPEGYGEARDVLSFWPGDAAWTLPVQTVAVLLTLQWWANWYPGAEPGGGGYVAQRLFATKNERHAMLAGLWFNIAHYAVRPWPWIVVGLCGAVLYGNTMIGADGKPDPELNYIEAMNRLLPDGYRGLLLVAFGAAFMSTISTQVNWGASYLVNDLYRPFIKPDADQRHYVRVSRLATVVILLVSIIAYKNMTTVDAAWKFLIGLGAGTGLVLILRWYWWRITAVSEIAAMLAALCFSLVSPEVLSLDDSKGAEFALKLVLTVAFTTAVWLGATFLSAPESRETLRAFCRRVRAPGPGWRRIEPESPPIYVGVRLMAWLSSLAVVYGTLFAIGHLLLGRGGSAVMSFAIGGAGALVLFLTLRHPTFKDVKSP